MIDRLLFKMEFPEFRLIYALISCLSILIISITLGLGMMTVSNNNVIPEDRYIILLYVRAVLIILLFILFVFHYLLRFEVEITLSHLKHIEEKADPVLRKLVSEHLQENKKITVADGCRILDRYHEKLSVERLLKQVDETIKHRQEYEKTKDRIRNFQDNV